MSEILIGWRLDNGKNLTYCENESVALIMSDLADEVTRAQMRGEPIYTIHLEYGEPIEESE